MAGIPKAQRLGWLDSARNRRQSLHDEGETTLWIFPSNNLGSRAVLAFPRPVPLYKMSLLEKGLLHWTQGELPSEVSEIVRPRIVMFLLYGLMYVYCLLFYVYYLHIWP